MRYWLKLLVIVVICSALAVGIVQVAQSGGALRFAIATTAGLVFLGSLLLAWSGLRDQGNNLTLETFLHDAGQALLLGAVLTFAFAIVGEQFDDEKALRDLRRDNQSQVRTDAGGKVFDGTDLRQSTLQGLNLRNFSFISADLGGADLFATKLIDANLSNANLEEANLGFADLTGAVFTNSDLRGADLSRSILNDTNFNGANITGTNFQGAHIVDADFSRIECDETTTWPDGHDAPPRCS